MLSLGQSGRVGARMVILAGCAVVDFAVAHFSTSEAASGATGSSGARTVRVRPQA